MIQVKVMNVAVDGMLKIVYDLKQQGYAANRDFEFAYYPVKHDYLSGDREESFVIFTFENEQLATWFSLKYVGQYVEK
jgi:hypothetical protein